MVFIESAAARFDGDHSDSLSTFFSNFPVLTPSPSSKQIKLALIFSSKSVNPGSHLTNPICKVKERVGQCQSVLLRGGAWGGINKELSLKRVAETLYYPPGP